MNVGGGTGAGWMVAAGNVHACSRTGQQCPPQRPPWLSLPQHGAGPCTSSVAGRPCTQYRALHAWHGRRNGWGGCELTSRRAVSTASAWGAPPPAHTRLQAGTPAVAGGVIDSTATQRGGEWVGAHQRRPSGCCIVRRIGTGRCPTGAAPGDHRPAAAATAINTCMEALLLLQRPRCRRHALVPPQPTPQPPLTAERLWSSRCCSRLLRTSSPLTRKSKGLAGSAVWGRACSRRGEGQSVRTSGRQACRRGADGHGGGWQPVLVVSGGALHSPSASRWLTIWERP